MLVNVELYIRVICTLNTSRLHLGSALAEDGELDADITHRVQSGWKNRKRASGVLYDRGMNVNIKGKITLQR